MSDQFQEAPSADHDAPMNQRSIEHVENIIDERVGRSQYRVPSEATKSGKEG
ncbi:MAG: hypothetical protein ACRDZT_04170 [Acidimicrobiales bacterium]